MASYKIQIKPSAIKELGKIPKRDFQKLVKKIQLLSSNPRPVGCEKLSSDEKYRIRQDNYRIVYGIDDDRLIVIVVKIGHRKDVYRNR